MNFRSTHNRKIVLDQEHVSIHGFHLTKFLHPRRPDLTWNLFLNYYLLQQIHYRAHHRQMGSKLQWRSLTSTINIYQFEAMVHFRKCQTCVQGTTLYELLSLTLLLAGCFFTHDQLVGGSNPSEKYESQLGWWNSQYMGKYIKCSSHHQLVKWLQHSTISQTQDHSTRSVESPWFRGTATCPSSACGNRLVEWTPRPKWPRNGHWMSQNLSNNLQQP